MGGGDKIGRYAYLTEMDEHVGEDCLVKGISVGAKAAVIGASFGAVQAAVVEVPTALPGIFFALRLMGRHATFCGAVGAAFASTACFAAAIRQKDDFRNWAYGGLAAGSVIGLKYRRVPIGIGASVGLAFLMGFIKLTEVYKDPMPYRDYRGRKGIDRPW